MICDRKFTARDLLQVFEQMSDAKEAVIRQQEASIKGRKARLDDLQAELADLALREELKVREFEGEMEEAEARKEVVENRIRETKNENEILAKRISNRNEETSKKEEEKNRIVQEVDLLKADVNELMVRMNGLAKLQTKYQDESEKRKGKEKGIYDSQNALSINGGKSGRIKKKEHSSRENVKSSMVNQHENCGK